MAEVTLYTTYDPGDRKNEPPTPEEVARWTLWDDLDHAEANAREREGRVLLAVTVGIKEVKKLDYEPNL